MSEPSLYYECCARSLNRQDEEVCGDQVKTFFAPERSIVALADGVGGGIQAAIPARLTAEIIVTMLREAATLSEVLETIIGTLPHSPGHGATRFSALELCHTDGRFQLVNFESPAPIFLRAGQPLALESREEQVCGRRLSLSQGRMQRGDFLGLMSDGVLEADGASAERLQSGWQRVVARLDKGLRARADSAEELVQSVMVETRKLFGQEVSDDATFVGLAARKARHLIVFSGPPADRSRDELCAQRVLGFEGRRVLCGGTTANIVGEFQGEVVRTELSTGREGIPPAGDMAEIDLVTEGILTLARTLELLKQCQGDKRRLPCERNAAVLLAREFLGADTIEFLAGESVNPYYQNPQLPRSVSIRRSLISQLAQLLELYHKQVRIEWV